LSESCCMVNIAIIEFLKEIINELL
jgi:hypothetical protein